MPKDIVLESGDNDDEDLSKLDRGDNVDPTDTEAERLAAEAAEAERLAAEAEQAEIDAEAAALIAAENGAEETDGDDDDDKSPVPYKRMKQVIDQNKKLMAELEAAKATPATPAQPVVTDKNAAMVARKAELYDLVEEARLEGDTALARTLQQELDEIRVHEIVQQSRAASIQTIAMDKSTVAYNALLDKMEASFPQLLADKPEYDQQLVQDLNFTIDSFIANGLPQHIALEKAQKLILGDFPDTKTTKKEDAPKGPSDKRKAAIEAAVKAIKGQAPDGATRGQNKEDIQLNATTLTEDEFDALPEAKKAQMRGDYIS